ncbi:MAG TPA: cobalamin B12-binding domain-containing protein [Desulfobacteraceae bacterium]|nr:cobalamin B12-binding domain-containing protein [Desulfobacteraceae bacterium]
MNTEKRIRILLAKVGLDGHDRGLKIISVLLRDEGFEVINLGPFQTAETIINVAEQEDVDVIGLSIHGEEYRIYVPIIIELMKEKGLNDRALILGGVLPPEDIPELKRIGVDEIFISGTPVEEIKRKIIELVKEKGR